MPKLIVSIDNVVVKEVQLTKDRSTIGRRPHNDIVIDNLAVSGEHAVICLANGRATLEDVGSTNGTYVNGKAIKKQALANNDSIQIGKYHVKYLEGQGAPAPVKQVATVTTPSGDAEAGVTLPMVVQTSTGPRVRVLNGLAANREMELIKSVTTLGKPGMTVAAIARTSHGFDISHVEGQPAATVNGISVERGAITLKSHDQIEIGGSRLEFVDH